MVVADTVFVNGKIATVDKNFSFKRALAVKNGYIIATGEDADILAYSDNGTSVIDLGGKTVLPGINDSHVHVGEFMAARDCVDLNRNDIRSIADLQNALAQAAKNVKPGEWIRGNSLDPSAIEECVKENRMPNRFDIDPVTRDVPVVIESFDGHFGLANQKALELAGITKDTPDPIGGSFGRDETGAPTGALHDHSAFTLLFKKVPKLTRDEIKKHIVEAHKILNSMGYTAYTEAVAGPGFANRGVGATGIHPIEAFRELEEEGKLTCRVSIGFNPGVDGQQTYEYVLNDLDKFPFPKYKDPKWVDIHMVKLFCDGVHMDHSAWMKNDYADAPGNHGHSCFGSPGAPDEDQAAELRRIIKLIHARGYQIGVHTVGDRSVGECIGAFIEAMRDNPRPDPRHYVIHGDSLGDREDFYEAAKYGIGLSCQSNLFEYLVEPTAKVVGEKKAEMLMGIRDIMEMGVWVANGSDTANGAYVDWLHAISACVTRRSRISGKVYRPDLAVTVEQAVRSFTINGAYQEFAENYRGSLEPNKVADLIVLDQDIFTIEKEKICDIKVDLTMVEGKIVYER